MKTLVLMILMSVNMILTASEEKIILKVIAENGISDKNLISEAEIITESFLSSGSYVVFRNTENKINMNLCDSENCILRFARDSFVSNVVIIRINMINENYEFTFNLYDLKMNKRYSIRKVYRKDKSRHSLINFLLPELKELFAYKKDFKFKKKAVKHSRNYNEGTGGYSKKSIRERRNLGINAEFGGSSVVGLTLDTFIFSGYINLELSLIAGFLPFVAGFKFYLTPYLNSSLYAGLHVLLPVDEGIKGKYFPVGFEYIADNGFTFSIEAGVLSLDIEHYGEEIYYEHETLPWGGMKIGYHF